jgi:hypothetical protein
MTTISSRSVTGHINLKYGAEPVRTFYTHFSDQFAPFHAKAINVGVRDATYVLEGLLYHESDLRIEDALHLYSRLHQSRLRSHAFSGLSLRAAAARSAIDKILCAKVNPGIHRPQARDRRHSTDQEHPCQGRPLLWSLSTSRMTEVGDYGKRDKLFNDGA